MALSICTTNYNCAHALTHHLRSVYAQLDGFDFEYIVTDNRSSDAGPVILRDWSAEHDNMTVISRRCTMGEGRQISFEHSSGGHIVVLDTDVIYSGLLRNFVTTYLGRYQDLAIQAVYCGIFPRSQWIRVGGRRSLNTNEDLDMWLRLSQLGTMRWYPVALGANMKEPFALGSSDHLSKRYSKGERVVRRFRREWDLLKTRHVQSVDLDELVSRFSIDVGIGGSVGPWPQQRVRVGRTRRVVALVRDLRQVIRDS